MSTPLVSIVIANYNYAEYLAEAIESALTQSYQAVEVVVVDDASTDNSREVITAFGDRVRSVMLPTNVGQGAGYQAGFELCRGSVICFLDSDDRLAHDAVERVVAAWRPGVSKVHSRVQIMDINGESQGYTEPPASLPLDRGNLAPMILKRGYYYMPPSGGNFYARSAVEVALPLMVGHHRISADYPMYMVAAMCGEVAAVDEPLLFYRLHDRSLSRLNLRKPERMAECVRNGFASHEAILKAAAAFGHTLPRSFRVPAHSQACLALRVLHPEHYPAPSVPVSRLAIEAAIAAFQLDVSPIRRLRAALGLATVAILPRPLARGLMTWVQYPRSRPAGLSARVRLLLGAPDTV